VCRKICSLANEIAGYGGLNFFLVISRELSVKCVIGFGRFVRISPEPMEMIERDLYFQC
jgi:hypothetical protein